MLTKSDIKIIKNVLKSEIDPLKQDISGFKKDLLSVKGIVEFTKDAVINILDWTQDIHESIVMKELPERVDKLEKVIKYS